MVTFMVATVLARTVGTCNTSQHISVTEDQQIFESSGGAEGKKGERILFMLLKISFYSEFGVQHLTTIIV